MQAWWAEETSIESIKDRTVQKPSTAGVNQQYGGVFDQALNKKPKKVTLGQNVKPRGTEVILGLDWDWIDAHTRSVNRFNAGCACCGKCLFSAAVC